MSFSKHFLTVIVILFLSFNQKILAMESDLPVSRSIVRTVNLPGEIHVVVLSYLEQNALLRAGHVSKTWRQAAEKVWQTKPLDLSNRHLNEADYQALANGSFPFLVLRSVNLGKKEVEILAYSSRFTHLDLSNNSIGADGAGKLAAAHFPLLTTLDLSYNDIKDDGVGKLAAAQFPLLTTLDLSRNSIKDDGAGKLATANFPLLMALNLSYNSIKDDGAGKLAAAHFPLLTTLNLRSNSIEPEGKGKLKKRYGSNVSF